ncbi:PEBP-like protein [Apiospora phragmitis]|uniref:PEBP-like protein n=1 Tax=Apiospora phragmitis TaxID=2905665 RepID=A0ABR1T3G8_9PEZI
MSTCQRVARPISRSMRQDRVVLSFTRTFSQSAARKEEATTTTTNTPPAAQVPPPSSTAADVTKEAPASQPKLTPDTATQYWEEIRLFKKGTPPVGSRRRRVAMQTSENVPFEQMPYQCFQEARRVLQEDRKEKLQALASEIAKVKRLEATPAAQYPGGEAKRNMRLESMNKWIEELKILVDINDPIVKRKFEDGLGDMDKPIYRHLAETKWRGYPFRLISQRIEQLNIVPDVLPKFEPTVDVQMFFRQRKTGPGEIINSRISEKPPSLKVQVFNPGERLVSVVVMDSDVPNAETDSFERRCHYLAANQGQQGNAAGRSLAARFRPKGCPYHRMSIWILEQKPGQALDLAKLKELYSGRDGFSLKSFKDKFTLSPVGFNIFRSVWDEGTAGVMERWGIPGADVEFKHARVYSLKGEKKARGWEAKRQKPKYKSLWKYTKRIRGMPRR